MIVVNILFKFTRLKLIYGYPLMADFFSETGLITETDTEIFISHLNDDCA